MVHKGSTIHPPISPHDSGEIDNGGPTKVIDIIKCIIPDHPV